MVKLSCPACGAEVKFRSGASVFAICAYCRAMLIRQDLDLKAIGKMAVLKEDSSPIQLGTAGVHDKTPFTAIGRVQMQWSDGMWNEWRLVFADGREGWLADAQGFYMVTFPFDDVFSPPDVRAIVPGAKLTIGKITYEVEDVRPARAIASEGELPFQAVSGLELTGVDLVGPGGRCASFTYLDGVAEVFTGRYVEFDELSLTNLRVFDGF